MLVDAVGEALLVDALDEETDLLEKILGETGGGLREEKLRKERGREDSTWFLSSFQCW